MTTKAEKVAELKALYPEIKIGSDEIGYTNLSNADYEARIAEWADNALAKEAEVLAAAQAKEALLAKLGITEDEAKLLLG
jgi:hypothetical protein